MSRITSKRQVFAPSCPSGGTYWACQSGTFFVGCCARNPCSVACPQGGLYPAAFDPARYGTFPDATCGIGIGFYTCTKGNVFLGCCKTNPCTQGGCPNGDLEPATLSRDDQRKAYFTGASTPTPKKTKVSIVAGSAVAGAVCLLIVLGFLIYYICHVKKSRRKHAEFLQQQVRYEPHRVDEKYQQVYSPALSSDWPTPMENIYSQEQFHDYHHQYQAHGTQISPQFSDLSQFNQLGHTRGISELSGVTVRSELEAFSYPCNESPKPEQQNPHQNSHF